MLSTLLMLTAMIIQLQSPLLTDDEWVADGWEITSRETYAISDYVEPYAVTEDGISEYFVELFFTEEGEFRAGIQGIDDLFIIDDNLPLNLIKVPLRLEVEITHKNNLIYVLGELHSTDLAKYDKLISTVEYLYTQDCPVSWMINHEGNIACLDGSTVAFFDIDGREIHKENYPQHYHGGFQMISNWAYARDGDLLIISKMEDSIVSAYDMSGNHLWDSEVDVRGGTMPMVVSNNGNTMCVTTTLNGCVVFDEHGNTLMNVLNDNNYMRVESMALSPNGEYAAITAVQCIPRAEVSDEQLYFIDIPSESIENMPLDSFSEDLSPQVMDISNDGFILCGLNRRSDDIRHRGGIVERRLGIFDRQGNCIWISDLTNMNDTVIETQNAVQPLSSFLNILYAFKGILYSDSNIELAYLDMMTGNIVKLSISKLMSR